MTKPSSILLLAALLFSAPGFAGFARADFPDEALYAKLVQPILDAKCVACHGAEKQKGKLRLDSLEEVMKGSGGENVIPGKVEDSLLTFRIMLPQDDDEVMPPEGDPPLTAEEIEILKFWVQSGAKSDAKIGDLKPAGAAAAAIRAALANPPRAEAVEKSADKPREIDPAKLKIAEETIGRVEKAGASLMAIAQDTPELRFSALNVAREFGDKNLEMLKPVADQILWMDLARTQVTDAGLAHLADMKNLNRLHLENTQIGDAGLDRLKGLVGLEYLNLYGTQVTDAGIQKLAGLKNLKKLYLWQSKVTEEGARKLAAQIPGLEVNTGWKEPALAVAAVAPTKPEQPAKPAAPAVPEPKKDESKKPAPTLAAPATATPATPAPAPAPKPAEPAKPAPPKPQETPSAEAGSLAAFGATIDKLLAEAKRVSAEANRSSAQAAKTAEEVKKIAETSTKSVAEAQKIADEARATAAAAKTAADEAKATAGAARTSAEAAQQAATEARKASGEASKIAGEARAALERLREAAAALLGPDAKDTK